MTETLKTPKSWRNEQNLNHNFVSYSDHTPRCGLCSSHQDAWSCPRPCLVLPGQLHMTLVFQRHSKHFLLTFRDTLETKKVNKARSNPRSQQHIVPTFLRQRLSHSSDGSLKRGRQRAVDHRARRDHRS